MWSKNLLFSLYCERPGYEKGCWNKHKIQEMDSEYIINCLNKLNIQWRDTPSSDWWKLKFTSDKIDEFKEELKKRGIEWKKI